MILLLIILATHINVSYASFPVADTLKVKQDTLKTEEIKKYHDHLIKMGIDLNSCKCESCRNGITPLTNNREVNKPLNQFKRIFGISRLNIFKFILEVNKKNIKKPDIDEQVKTILKENYKDDIKKLSRIISKDLGHWLEF